MGGSCSGSSSVSQQCQMSVEDSALTLHIDIVFSLMSDVEMGDKSGKLIGENLFNKVHLLHERRWESGEYPKHEITPESIIFIDCSILQYYLETQRIVDTMTSKLNEAVNRIQRYITSKITMSVCHGEVHLYIHAFSPAEPLAFALAKVFKCNLDGRKDNFSSTDKRLLDYGKQLVSKFDEYRSSGWKLKVDYGSVWEHKILLVRKPNVKPALSLGEIEMMLMRMNKFPPSQNEPIVDKENMFTYTFSWIKTPTLDGDTITYTRDELMEQRDYLKYGKSYDEHLKDKKKREKERDINTIHLMLGISSIIFTPLALVDAGVHTVEAVSEGSVENHWKDIAVDVVCYIVARGLGRAALKANMAKEAKAYGTTVEGREAAKAASVAESKQEVQAAKEIVATKAAEAEKASAAARAAEKESEAWAESASGTRLGKREAREFASDAEAAAEAARAKEAEKAAELAQAEKDLTVAEQKALSNNKPNRLDNSLNGMKADYRDDVLTFKVAFSSIYSVNDIVALWRTGKVGKAGAVASVGNTAISQAWVVKSEYEGIMKISDNLQYNDE